MAITLKDAVIITDNNVIEHLKKGNECAFRFIFDKYYDYQIGRASCRERV